MSGRSLSYFYLQLQEHIGDFGDKELDDLVSDLADLFYAREWYLSSDTCKDDWMAERDKFKDKWFTEYGRQERIKKYVEEIRSNVLDMFGIDDRKRDTCEYWSHESDNREVFSTCNPIVKVDDQIRNVYANNGRIFQEIVVGYPEYSTYPEYKGKPYFLIKYTENGKEFIGYGTFKPEVLSEFLKKYFMPSAQSEPQYTV